MQLAQDAGRVSRKYFQDGHLGVQTKADGTPVTDADREIELLFRDAVRAEFADDGFTGEEYPDTDGDSGYRWIVDPIDGTKSFIHGVPLYANLIALQEGDEIVFGIINLHAFGYAMVACGRGDAVVDYTAQAFDLAPMSVIIEEAGGRFTSLDGRRVFDARNGMASNGLVHDELLAYVAPRTASTIHSPTTN
jgi:fructose-1,6-bisphosphatase/inositol monophosphatase family enzyme